MKYLWSDTHFGHVRILEFQKHTRPFSSVEDMNGWMITSWNSVVRNGDEIYLVGDFSFEKDPSSTFSRLHGTKHLIRGNHDAKRKAVLDLPWASVSDIAVIKENGVRVMACHYPMESWDQAHRGTLHAHGHCHGSLKREMAHRFDVGVDVFRSPVSVTGLAELASAQEFQPSDHHA